MTFDNINIGNSCDCINGLSEDTTSTYARVLSKDTLKPNDFKSKWDKEHRATECRSICSLKGVSISKIDNDAIKEEIIKYYTGIFPLSPKYKRSVYLFKLKEGAGVIKPTPSKDNKYHNDLYKSDLFDYNFIEEVENCDLISEDVSSK